MTLRTGVHFYLDTSTTLPLGPSPPPPPDLRGWPGSLDGTIFADTSEGLSLGF